MTEEMNKNLSEEMTEEIQDAPSGFAIEDDMTADWAIRRIAQIDAEADRMIDFYEAQIKKCNEKRDARKDFLLEHLRRYTNTLPMRETKTQLKYALPSGDLVIKKAAMTYKRDDEQLLRWIQKNDLSEFTQVKVSPAWGELKKHLTIMGDSVVLADTGEIVEGVEAVEAEPTFMIKTREEEK